MLESGADVLLVRASIIDLNINAPDPDGLSGLLEKTYSESAGDATAHHRALRLGWRPNPCSDYPTSKPTITRTGIATTARIGHAQNVLSSQTLTSSVISSKRGQWHSPRTSSKQRKQRLNRLWSVLLFSSHATSLPEVAYSN